MTCTNTPHTLSKPHNPSHNPKAYLISVAGYSKWTVFLPTLQKTLLLFESFKTKSELKNWTNKKTGDKAHGANKMFMQCGGLV
jgi:hypothetical protein